jgi:peroxiredoxin
MSNDQEAYPDDSFQNMKKFSNENNFTFPYLLDSTQNIAKYYGAVCTPDFFCFNNKDKMFYRGRLDNIKYNSKNKKRIASLVNAVEKMIKFKSIDDNQVSSMGCSIKWKKN